MIYIHTYIHGNEYKCPISQSHLSSFPFHSISSSPHISIAISEFRGFFWWYCCCCFCCCCYIFLICISISSLSYSPQLSFSFSLSPFQHDAPLALRGPLPWRQTIDYWLSIYLPSSLNQYIDTYRSHHRAQRARGFGGLPPLIVNLIWIMDRMEYCWCV